MNMKKRINTNKMMLDECKKRDWGPKQVWELLNQGQTDIKRTTVSRWFVNKKLPGFLKMGGHWYDLFVYRLNEKSKNRTKKNRK